MTTTDSIHADLLALLLPPVSYDPNAQKIRTECALDGLALDRAYEAAYTPLKGLTPFHDDAWLAAYETTYALPGQCFSGALTRDERIIQLAVALKERRGISKEYYYWLAKVCGYQITIEEFQPFTAGSYAGSSLYHEGWEYIWLVRTSATPSQPFRSGRNCAGDPLQQWGNQIFECLFRQHAPAHTLVHFAYGNKENLCTE